MSDKRHLIDAVRGDLCEIWHDVLPSFDGEHSAVRWLTKAFQEFGGQTPLDLLKGTAQQRQTVMAVLQRMDGIRIG